MKLEQLKYVLEIVKLGSMNKASKSLLISQPNLSFSVKSLEAELGYKIFNRTTKGIELTIEGALFTEHAKNMMQSYDSINNINKTTPVMVDNALDLTISAQYSSQVFFSLLDLFESNKLKNINFNLNQTNLSQVINDVSSGKSNLGFVFIDDTNKSLISNNLSLNKLEFVKLDSPELYSCMMDSHPLANNEKVSVYDLINYPLAALNFTANDFLYSSLYMHLGLDKFKQKIELTDYYALMIALKKLNAVTFIIKFANTDISYDFEGSNLIYKDIDLSESLNLEFGYIKVSNNLLSHTELEFISFLNKNLNKMQNSHK